MMPNAMQTERAEQRPVGPASTYGFSKDLGPNNFHINEPNAVFGGRDARKPWCDPAGITGRDLFSSPAYYQPQNVSKMKLLEELENADEAAKAKQPAQ